ncbi:DNA-binding transcriptional regulator DsdC [Providencia rettgeri]|nr:DNA-binding transcriptional regulator DsdC [uncultured Providencia sp.]MDK3108886.1 DNA-binding transcriptional regulator DsdC [Providencia rettgeri]
MSENFNQFEQSGFIQWNKRLSSYQLSRLHTFEAAARHLSFALAAQELSLTPSAVSHRINMLEGELGFKLFERFHRRIELTSDGERIYWALRKNLDDINQEIIDIKNQEISGELTVYSRPSIAQCWLIPKIADFANQYPSIQLNLLTGNDDVNFRGYGIDIAIYYDDMTRSNLYCEDLMTESIVPVCSPQYAQQYDLLNNIHQLKNCTLLHDRQAWSSNSDYDEWKAWSEHYQLALFPHRRNLCFDRSDLAIVAAMNHAGVAMGRKQLVEKRLKRQELVMPFGDISLKCQQRYYFAMLNEKRNPKADIFIQWLKQQVNAIPQVKWHLFE